MRNLRNIGHGIFRGPGPSSASVVSASCWDVARDAVIVARGPTPDDAQIELLRLSRKIQHYSPFHLQSKSIASWDAPSPTQDGGADVIRGMHYFSDTLTTCLIMAGGDIVTVTEDEEGIDAHVEIVGTLSPSIAAARWSPDEELLVLATGDAKVVFMSRSFDLITEAVLSADDLKLSKHVSVGWGKKETQFQGRGAKAKALRDPTIPEKVDEGVLSPNDDGRCSISWRGDGAYVAVNFLQEGLRRAVRVYNRDGELDSVSEPVDGLEGSLSWRPEGNLIAGIQRLADRVDVVFFERNGLRHGQFTLHVPADAPGGLGDLALEWNSDSTVLAVILKDRVQLWTTGNYHWYLKQEIPCSQRGGIGAKCERPRFSWHAEKPLLFAAGTAGKVLVNEYALTVSRGPTRAPYDYGAVAVIDGRTVKFTPFRTANVPPPMALCELEVESPVIDVAFATDCSSMAVLHRVGVSYFALETNGSRLSNPRLVSMAAFEKADSQLHEGPYQIGFSTRSEVQVLQMADDLELLRHDFDASRQGAKTWLKTDASSVGTITSPDSSAIEGVVAHHIRGRVSCILAGEHSPQPVQFPSFLPCTSFVTHNGELIAFGLSRNGHLYANSRQLAKNCTSFLVTENHLIFTTSNHFVKFVHLADEADLDVPHDDPEKDERCRSIERGGKLVTAMPTKMSLVLQMPRGNLETIYPRAMVLAGIRHSVEQKDYGSAFATCRTQRVDMNILFDHRPEQFLDNVGLFLDQVKSPADVDLFLSALKDEDVTQTMYRDTKSFTAQQPPDPKAAGKPGKVNTVCDAVLQKLQTQRKAKLQNIITAHVCKSPPALDDGLLVVAELMREDEALAERAVEHICFLADVNKLYDHALGLYNLDLALLVAQQSQRDPREYLPFVQELHRMPPLKRQFTIDDKLEHWEKAMGHLKVLNNFDDVKNYVVKHQLYKQALAVYRHEEQHRMAITDLFAAHLKSLSQFKEAGLAYESLGNFSDATDCYLKAGASCWRECLYVAQQQQNPPLGTDKLHEIAASLADALREAKDYASAAVIHLDYLASVESAVHCLCKGYLFADALRLVALHRRPDLLAGAVDPGLADALSSSTEFLADCKAQLRAQVPRIAELRRKAREDPLAFYEGESPHHAHGARGADVPDDVSVAASTARLSTSASLFTRYTGKAGSAGTLASNVSRATSKNRKREEKKRARGRKGTVYEEEYLVNSVRRLVARVESATAEVERLVLGLARRDMAERARAVEELAAQVLEGCRAAVREVWLPEAVGEAEAAGAGEDPAAAGYRPGGGDGVLFDSLEAMRARQVPPVVGDFARLSLLGKAGSSG
ncbi:IkappaB kinase complex, IKAP component [Trichocladium antarcticum]|uniref:Elongator complex protein 1 n=1 Tax=Trichocladium antarcticum TaxID=1450529 RepID=A0AAN6UPQ1_9PEZI|nr:IkappaB kinase complex, IKAP component [Trichocladium antarcticum]